MNMKKGLLIILGTLALCVSLVSCGGRSDDSSSLDTTTSETTSTVEDTSEDVTTSETTSETTTSEDSSTTSSSEATLNSVSLSASETTLTLGDTLQLSVTTDPASGVTLAYTSSDLEVATVSETGLVSTVGVGSVDISVSAKLGETTLTDAVNLTVNPDVEEVLASLQHEIALTGTLEASIDGEVVETHTIDTYLNTNADALEAYYHYDKDNPSLASETHYSSYQGYLATYVLNSLNQIVVFTMVDQNYEEKPAADYIMNGFDLVSASELVVVDPTHITLSIDAAHAASTLFIDITGYSSDGGAEVELVLNKDGSIASIVLDATYSSTLAMHYVGTLTTKSALNVPSNDPLPELTGTDEALLDSFIDGLTNENYTLGINVEDLGVAYDVLLTQEGLVLNGTIYALVDELGVMEVTVDTSVTPNTLVGASETPIGSAVSELLYPVKVSSDIFVPQGSNQYTISPRLAFWYERYYGGILMGLDPSIAFVDDSFPASALSSVMLTLEADADNNVTDATLSYTTLYYGYIECTVSIEITDIGTTVFPYVGLEFVPYTPPTTWSELDASWYSATNSALGVDLNDAPYVEADWITYENEGEYGVQALYSTSAEATTASEAVVTTFIADGWTTTGEIDGYGSPVYGKEGTELRISTSAWEANEGYVCDIIFFNASAFALPESWNDVDTTWVEDASAFVGADVSTIPFYQAMWKVGYSYFDDEYYLVTTVTSEAAASELINGFVQVLTTAGWTEFEYTDPYGYTVYVNADETIAVALGYWGYSDTSIQVEMYVYAPDMLLPPASWEEVNPDWYATMCEETGVDISEYIPYIIADWHASTWSSYASVEFSDETEANAFLDQMKTELTEAGWIDSSEVDEYGVPIYTHTEVDFTISLYVDQYGYEGNYTYDVTLTIIPASDEVVA